MTAYVKPTDPAAAEAIDIIRSTVAAWPYTAPEMLPERVRTIINAIASCGWLRDGVEFDDGEPRAREAACTLSHVASIVAGREPEVIEPYTGNAVEVVDAVRSLVAQRDALIKALVIACTDLAAGPELPPGWQRTEHSHGDHTSVRWERATDGREYGLDLIVTADGPLADTLEVDAGVSLAEVAAVLTIESRRGLGGDA